MELIASFAFGTFVAIAILALTENLTAKERIKWTIFGFFLPVIAIPCYFCRENKKPMRFIGLLVLTFLASAVVNAFTSQGSQEPHKEAVVAKVEAPAQKAPEKAVETASQKKARLLKEAAEQKRVIAVQKQEEINDRKAFAKKYEQSLLEKGLDAYVSTQGKEHKTLKVRFVLASRPMIYQLSKNEEFSSTMSMLGFKKVLFSDGYGSSYWITYN